MQLKSYQRMSACNTRPKSHIDLFFILLPLPQGWHQLEYLIIFTNSVINTGYFNSIEDTKYIMPIRTNGKSRNVLHKRTGGQLPVTKTAQTHRTYDLGPYKE